VRILLDECVPRRFKNYLPSHQWVTVPDAGWAGKKNGELLPLAEQAGFEVFVTLDRGVEYEQNLTGRRISVILVRATSSRLTDLIPHAERILSVVESIESGQLVQVP
jgi:predicted nuclease of predicted toxin-antitoxin system